MSKKSLALYLLSLRYDLAHLKSQINDLEKGVIEGESNWGEGDALMEYGADKIIGITNDIMETAKKIKEEVSEK